MLESPIEWVQLKSKEKDLFHRFLAQIWRPSPELVPNMELHLGRVSLGKVEGVTFRFIHLELFLLQYSAAAYEFEFLYLHYFQYQFD